jgi:hypothetical protein
MCGACHQASGDSARGPKKLSDVKVNPSIAASLGALPMPAQGSAAAHANGSLAAAPAAAPSATDLLLELDGPGALLPCYLATFHGSAFMHLSSPAMQQHCMEVVVTAYVPSTVCMSAACMNAAAAAPAVAGEDASWSAFEGGTGAAAPAPAASVDPFAALSAPSAASHPAPSAAVSTLFCCLRVHSV